MVLQNPPIIYTHPVYIHIGTPTACPKVTRTQLFHFTFIDFTRAESVVGVLITFQSDKFDVVLRFQAGRSHTSCHHSVQRNVCSYLSHTGGYFPGQSSRGLKPVTQLHQFPRLRMSGAAVPIHPHVFVDTLTSWRYLLHYFLPLNALTFFFCC